MNYRVTLGAFGIIFNKDRKVLLAHRRDRDLWNLPGGGIEKGETPEEAVIREIKEETSLDARVMRLAGIYFKPKEDDLVFAFDCDITGGEVKTTNEAGDVRFFDIEELPKNISPKQVERVKDAFLNSDKPIFKIQTQPKYS